MTTRERAIDVGSARPRALMNAVSVERPTGGLKIILLGEHPSPAQLFGVGLVVGERRQPAISIRVDGYRAGTE